ncbi:MAG: hypothetical protein JWO53_276 [Chlamydiia bacterium]|nr:hypothetical protein [Chlamydiia bacterium]
MQYFLSADQKAFFENHGFIEFEGLVSDEQLAVLKRHKGTRDVSRKDPQIEKIVKSAVFSKLASQLSLKKLLRFGYDEVYELPIQRSGVQTLEEANSIRGLVCGLMICIDGESDQAINGLPFNPFPKKPGNIILFLPTLAWDFDTLTESTKQKFLLITYAGSRAMYVYEERDPYLHELKKLGYVFGDRLSQTCHPILSR